MNKKSDIDKINKQIDKNNAKFEKLSASQKRVAIARDVLAQLKSKRLVAKHGFWITKKTKTDFISSKKPERELKEVFSEIKSCNVCALGAMFFCAVEKANKIKVKNLIDFSSPWYVNPNNRIPVEISDITKYLKKYFSIKDIKNIECAFESGGGAFTDNTKAANFVNGINSPSERMQLIMKNIIANNGEFVLP